MPRHRLAIVFGGCGSLGKAVVQELSANGFRPISIDPMNNAAAHWNIVVRPSWSMHEQSAVISQGLKDIIQSDKVSNVFCAAGGWRGGSIRDGDFLHVFSESHRVNVEPAILAAFYGAQYLANGGLLTLTGASSVLQTTPGMLAYGLAKTTTHNLIKNVAEDEYFKQEGISVLGILPSIIDTFSNRFNMPNADFNQWTQVIVAFKFTMLCISDVTLLLWLAMTVLFCAQPGDIAAKYVEWVKGAFPLTHFCTFIVLCVVHEC
jgi:dihydropteridine reductase